MTSRSAALAGALVLALVVLAGCGGKAADPAAGGSGVQQAVERPATEQSGTPGASISGVGSSTSPNGAAPSGKVDVKSIEDQLDAMQRELDSLSMPSDGDFKGAEGAVY